jgi:hypothetical protein
MLEYENEIDFDDFYFTDIGKTNKLTIEIRHKHKTLFFAL